MRSRQFAVAIMNAGKQAEVVVPQLPAMLRDARGRLQSVRTSTVEIQQAQAYLAQMEFDSAILAAVADAKQRVEQAEERLRAARSSPSALTTGPNDSSQPGLEA
jgi:predicted S18 family serine protease